MSESRHLERRTPAELIDLCRTRGFFLRVDPHGASGLGELVVETGRKVFSDRDPAVVEATRIELREVLGKLPGNALRDFINKEVWEGGSFLLAIAVPGVEENYLAEVHQLLISERERLAHYQALDANFDKKVLEEIEEDQEVVRLKAAAREIARELDTRREAAFQERQASRSAFRYVASDREL